MLTETFLFLCRVPLLRKLGMRSLYETLALVFGDQTGLAFMNYGYRSAPDGRGASGAEASGGGELKLDESEEADRYAIQLYHRTATGAGRVDLKGRAALEIGSGRGGGAAYIARRLGPARMVGMDFSAGQVEFCRRVHSEPNLEFHPGDAEDAPFSDASFDCIVNVESSHCYEDMDRFLSEVRRLLKPGGFFLYTDFRGRIYETLGDSRDPFVLWREQLDRSGLEQVEEEDITENVVLALEADHERRFAAAREITPPFLLGAIEDFAGTRNSYIYKTLKSREVLYKRFIFRKPA